jgi:hypothetical protein
MMTYIQTQAARREPQRYSWQQADNSGKLLQLLTAAVRANWAHLHNKLSEM